MTDYRLYCLDRHGKIQSAEWISAPTDEDARAQAVALAKPTVCEVWERSRLVATIPPGDDNPANLPS